MNRNAHCSKVLVSGKSDGRERFFLALLEKSLNTSKATIVFDLENTITNEISMLCQQIHYPLRIQGAVISFQNWTPSQIAQFISDALKNERDVQHALLYRFAIYLAKLYQIANQELTIEELAECDIRHIQQAAGEYGYDEAYEFMREFSNPLMNIETTLQNYGRVLSENGCRKPKRGECLVLCRQDSTGIDVHTMQLKALDMLLDDSEVNQVNCFQWGIDENSNDELSRFISKYDMDFTLFAKDALRYRDNSNQLIDNFNKVILLRHSNPESCRAWAEIIGKQQTWNPSISNRENKMFQLFRTVPLPLPNNQGTLYTRPRKDQNVSYTKQESYRIQPARLAMLPSNSCVMIDRNKSTADEICLF